ncbi:hypothetical protein HPB49_007056 [Dermacentor silvarum]|uniref:Uncharacterized protein n=1 Tax=Dermacentor silvarum TaxID=543639 RepID=A0ACB8D3P2_DERSI|nr:hypothetical protein HPB49_007056 [Dermacentor silvarum]
MTLLLNRFVLQIRECAPDGLTWKAATGAVKRTIEELVKERSHDKMVKHKKKAALLRTAVKGVEGPTPLMNLPNSILIWGSTANYMHCVLLGVTRQITEL